MAESMSAPQQFVQALPHGRELGLKIVAMEPGKVSITMPYDEKLVGDPRSGVIAGGAVSTVIDTCCGAAAMTHPDAKGSSATLDLRIDYMRTATPGQSIIAHAVCYHMTRSVAFVRATAHDDDSDHPVATATGTFTTGRF